MTDQQPSAAQAWKTIYKTLRELPELADISDVSALRQAAVADMPCMELFSEPGDFNGLIKLVRAYVGLAQFRQQPIRELYAAVTAEAAKVEGVNEIDIINTWLQNIDDIDHAYPRATDDSPTDEPPPAESPPGDSMAHIPPSEMQTIAGQPGQGKSTVTELFTQGPPPLYSLKWQGVRTSNGFPFELTIQQGVNAADVVNAVKAAAKIEGALLELGCTFQTGSAEPPAAPKDSGGRGRGSADSSSGGGRGRGRGSADSSSGGGRGRGGRESSGRADSSSGGGYDTPFGVKMGRNDTRLVKLLSWKYKESEASSRSGGTFLLKQITASFKDGNTTLYINMIKENEHKRFLESLGYSLDDLTEGNALDWDQQSLEANEPVTAWMPIEPPLSVEVGLSQKDGEVLTNNKGVAYLKILEILD